MGLDAERVRDLKRRYGARGLAGVSLHGNAPGSGPFPGKRKPSPFPRTDGSYDDPVDPDAPTPDSGGRLYDDSHDTSKQPPSRLYPDDNAEDDPAGLRVTRRMLKPKFPARKK